jgi:hypothetical protein
MRKVVLTLAAAGALLFVGAHGFQADATVGSGTHALPMPAKDDSPIDQVACKFAGPTCPIGYTRVCRLWRCWCARCH